jgi:hypothetical protein
VYEYTSAQQVIDRVSHIYALYRNSVQIEAQDSKERLAQLSLFRDLIDNVKHQHSRLSPRTLRQLSHCASLTVGGTFLLVGYHLDRMRDTEFMLNGHRTRIIESYPFYRDRMIDLPSVLSKDNVWANSALVSDIVREWQMDLPIRTIQDQNWQKRDNFYVQIGGEDNPALSGLPSGAIVLIQPVTQEERANPDPDAIYLLQFGNGYLCSCCAVSRGMLTLLPRDGKYEASCDFLYPQQVRIAGRARGFAAQVPPPITNRQEAHSAHIAAPLILPWEHASLGALLHTERLRLGRTARDLDNINDILQARMASSLTGRTLRRYEHRSQNVPHTDTILALALFCAARFSDVLRLLGFRFNESNSYSLARFLEAQSLKELHEKLRFATTPEPRAQWRLLCADWGEWPSLLSIRVPRISELQHRLLRIHQNETFDGLDPLIRTGTIGLLEEMNNLPELGGERDKEGWERPIYAIRHKGEIVCGYLDRDDQHVVLVPHPRSHGRRISLLRHQVQMVGQIKAIGSSFH